MASMLATEKAAPIVTPCSLHLRNTELASTHLVRCTDGHKQADCADNRGEELTMSIACDDADVCCLQCLGRISSAGNCYVGPELSCGVEQDVLWSCAA
jgi:hypothetical protein